MRLLVFLALLGVVVVPSLQQATDSSRSATSAIATASGVDCLAPCTRDYRPVCARYNGRRRTYANICLMRAAKRCARRSREQAAPEIHFLFKGTCRSRGRRRRRPNLVRSAEDSRVL